MFTLNSIVLPTYYKYEKNNKNELNNNGLYKKNFYNSVSNYSLNNNSINLTNECDIMELGMRKNISNDTPNINITISPKKKNKKKRKGRRKKQITTQNKNNNLFNIFNLSYIKIGLITFFGITLFTYYHKK